MGVWIETSQKTGKSSPILSHPVWVCGLKHLAEDFKMIAGSHTLYGCVD